MISSPKMKLPYPANWSDFEDLCLGLWKAVWKCESAQKNGRNGQSQDGVDFFGRPSNGASWAGVQCKGKDSYNEQVLTDNEISEETEKAKKFEPKLSEYTIATTAQRDVKVQMFARTISDANIKNGSFSVSVFAWDDIVELLYEHCPPIAGHYYPLVFGGRMAIFTKQLIVVANQIAQSCRASKKTDNFRPETSGITCECEAANPDQGTQVHFGDLSAVHNNSVTLEERRQVLEFISKMVLNPEDVSATCGTNSTDNSMYGALKRVVHENLQNSAEGGQPHE
jgi:hypothetical protein